MKNNVHNKIIQVKIFFDVMNTFEKIREINWIYLPICNLLTLLYNVRQLIIGHRGEKQLHNPFQCWCIEIKVRIQAQILFEKFAFN